MRVVAMIRTTKDSENATRSTLEDTKWDLDPIKEERCF